MIKLKQFLTLLLVAISTCMYAQLPAPSYVGSAKFSAKGDKIKASEGGHDLLVKCNLSYSTDGKKFQPLGETFQVKEGKWIGAKVGIFCTRPAIVTNDGGWTDADWFRIEK